MKLLSTFLVATLLLAKALYATSDESETRYNVYMVWAQTHVVLNTKHPQPAHRGKGRNISSWYPSEGKPAKLIGENKTRDELGDDLVFNASSGFLNYTKDDSFKAPSDWAQYAVSREIGMVVVAVPVDDEGEDLFSEDDAPQFSMFDSHEGTDSIEEKLKGSCGARYAVMVYDEHKTETEAVVTDAEPRELTFVTPECAQGTCSNDDASPGGGETGGGGGGGGGGGEGQPARTIKFYVGPHKKAPGGFLVVNVPPTGGDPTALSELHYDVVPLGVEVIRDGTNLRQIRTSNNLLNILPSAAGGYSVSWYPLTASSPVKNAQGVYDITGTAISTATVGGTADAMITTTVVDGVAKTWKFVRQNGEVIVHAGTDTDGNGATDISSTSTIEDAGFRFRREKQYDAAGAVASDVVTKFAQLPGVNGRWVVVERKSDPDSNPQITQTRTYETNPASASFGLLLSSTNADGSWEQITYHDGSAGPAGKVWKKLRPFGDSAPGTGRETEFLYDAQKRVSTQIEKVLGQEISRRTFTRVISANGTQTRTETVDSGGGPTQTTTTITYPTGGAVNAGRHWKTLRPNGTALVNNYWSQALTAPFSGTGRVTESLDGVFSGTTLTAGSRELLVEDLAGNFVKRTRWEIRNGQTVQTDSEQVLVLDAKKRATQVATSRGIRSTVYDCCGIVSETDENGLTTTYTRDSSGRTLTQVNADGTGQRFQYDGAGRTIKTWRTGLNVPEELLEHNVYALDGTLTSTTDGRGKTRTFTETTATGSGLIRTVTFAGSTEITASHRDGTPKSRSGTGVNPSTSSWELSGGRVALRETDGTNVWRLSVTDGSGRTLRTEGPQGVLQTFTYDSLGRLVRTTDGDGVATLQTYDSFGQVLLSGIDVNGDGTLQTDGSERVSRTDRTFTTRGTQVVEKSTTTAYFASGPVEVSRSETAVDGSQIWSASYGVESSSVIATNSQAGTRTETTTQADGTTIVRTFAAGRLQSETRTDSAATSSQALQYDALGRNNIAIRDGITTTTTYVPGSNLPFTVTVSAAGVPAQTTTYTYDDAGRVTTTKLPDDSEQHSEYFLTGLLKRTYGSQTYDTSNTYDAAGRPLTLTTHGATGPAVTTWNYLNGRLDSKEYADAQKTRYTYTVAGRLASRIWARAITTTYTYNSAGELAGTDYSDSTPDVSGLTYDGMGRLLTVSDASGSRTLTYSPGGQPASESWSSGIFGSASVTRGFDSLHRLQTLTLNGVTGQPLGSAITYGHVGNRITSVSTAGYTATQQWDATGSVPGNTIHQGTASLTMSRSYDSLRRLTGAGVTSQAHTSYTLNALNQRTQAESADGSRFYYGYDALGQVTSAARKWSSGSVVPGEQFGFGYDGIGNRLTATRNGQVATYTPNTLNQYNQRTVPGLADITGTAETAATVTVNGQATVRSEGGWFWKSLALDNSINPVFGAINVASTSGNTPLTHSGSAFVAKTPETFTYDLDGNLTEDGRFTYTWDGENRLSKIETRPAAIAVGTPGVRLTFSYDWMGRRVRKQVEKWSTVANTYQPAQTLLFYYDGWNLAAETLGNGTPVRSYIWGVDLSGSLQGAGGVGGLLRLTDNTLATPAHHAATYDGNGNVLALWNLADGTQSATYRYGPFGETLQAVGSMAESNPFKFSTKYQDGETGLLYYGYRYYQRGIGKWLSRDPIAEKGGVNLYCFLGNSATNSEDFMGLSSRSDIDKGILIYSTKAGWIDWGHANPKDAVAHLTNIRNEVGMRSKFRPEGYVLGIKQGMTKIGITLGVSGNYWVRYSLPDAGKLSAALGIFKDISDRFEDYQESFPLYERVKRSGNSEEDRPSNLISFYRAAYGYSQLDIQKMTNTVSKTESKCLWDAIGGIKKSRSWKPTDYNTELSKITGRTIPSLSWPAELSRIQDVPLGSTWQRADILDILE